MPRTPARATWTGKATAYKLWCDVNVFVDTYTSTHQTELESEWFRTWYGYFHTAQIGESNINLQLAAYVIVGNPNATLMDCVNKLTTLIPALSDYLHIHQISDNGNIRYTIDSYGFKTPKHKYKNAKDFQQTTNMKQLKPAENVRSYNALY